MTQNKFAFFANFSEAIKALPVEKQAGAYQAICEYGIYGTLPDDPMYLGLCLMAKASIYKEDGRANNGGNHNPQGINQHSENGQSGQKRSKLVNSVKVGQILSETETETETEDKPTRAEKAQNTRAVNKEIKANDIDTRYNQWLKYWMSHSWTQQANESFRKFLDEAKDYDPQKLQDLIKVFKDKAPELNDSMPDWA